MDFVEITFICDQELKEMLMAELAIHDFDSFLEDDSSLKGYIPSNLYDPKTVSLIETKYAILRPISTRTIREENWNQRWESEYNPITIDERCRISASFHELEPHYEYEILINPKMSFGTGHHETTSLMISQQLKLKFGERSVLDIGCGTGILSILAEQLGANRIIALDNDINAVGNAKENVVINNCQSISVHHGTIDQLDANTCQTFDIILANINRNVLICEIDSYERYLSAQGVLILSGFYTHDIDKIVDKGKQVNLSLIDQDEVNNWAVLIFGKKLA